MKTTKPQRSWPEHWEGWIIVDTSTGIWRKVCGTEEAANEQCQRITVEFGRPHDVVPVTIRGRKRR